MDNTVALALVTGMLTLLGTVFSGVMTYLMAKLSFQQTLAAAAARDVAVVLKDTTAVYTDKLNAIAETGNQVHTLVNSNMAIQLRINAAVTRRLANLTGDPEDERAAKVAEAMSIDHSSKQAALDAVKAASSAAK